MARYLPLDYLAAVVRCHHWRRNAIVFVGYGGIRAVLPFRAQRMLARIQGHPGHVDHHVGTFAPHH